MRKLKCGVVVITAVLAGACYADDEPKGPIKVGDKIPAWDKKYDKIEGSNDHAATAAVEKQLVRIDGNAKIIANQVDNNTDAISEINKEFITVKKEATAAMESAAAAQQSAATVTSLTKTVADNNTAINTRVDETNGRIDDTNGRISTVNTELGGRITSETTAINSRVEGVAGDVAGMKSNVASALTNSETALGAASRAETNASSALITAQRAEGAVAQERLDREEAVRNGVAESKAYTDSRFKDFGNKIEEVKKFAAAGTSAALAASQIPQVSQGSAFSLGLGVGSYSGQSALALGMSARLGDYTVTKMAVTSDTSNNIGVSGGIAVEW